MPITAICLVKPDGMERVREIRKHLATQGIQVIDERDHKISEDDVKFLYAPVLRTEAWAIELIMKSMVSHSVRVMLCKGDDNLLDTLFEAKQHLRKIYMKDNPKGVLHTSDNEEEATRESKYFFGVDTCS